MQLRRSAASATEAPCLHPAVPLCDRRSRERQPFSIRRYRDGLFRRCHSPLRFRLRGPPVFSPLPARAARVSLLTLFPWERKSASFILRQKLHLRQEAMQSRVCRRNKNEPTPTRTALFKFTKFSISPCIHVCARPLSCGSFRREGTR